MKPGLKTRSILTDIVATLYGLLFVYAAVSKIIDFTNFRIQLGQSPILSPFAEILSIVVPAVELILAALLFYPRFRLAALYGSYGLMSAFTAYIYLILNHSSYIPCSCGGILEKMGWNEHLWFNIAFIVLAIAAILCLPLKTTSHA